MRRTIIKLGSTGVDVFDWQYFLCLNECDGYFGFKTQEATMHYQAAHALVADGIVGAETWESAEGDREIEMATIAHVRGIEKLTIQEIKGLVNAAEWIGINPDWLAAVISFETAGTFNPGEVNRAGSGATGLIQFMPSTAKALGTTTQALSKMSFIEQLEYVKKYFAPVRGKLKSLEDTYLQVFYPKFIGRKASDVIASEGSAVYTQNRGFDKTGKGYITRGDVTASIVNTLQNAIASPRITIPMIGTGAAIAIGAISYGLFRLYQIRNA